MNNDDNDDDKVKLTYTVQERKFVFHGEVLSLLTIGTTYPCPPYIRSTSSAIRSLLKSFLTFCTFIFTFIRCMCPFLFYDAIIHVHGDIIVYLFSQYVPKGKLFSFYCEEYLS